MESITSASSTGWLESLRSTPSKLVSAPMRMPSRPSALSSSARCRPARSGAVKGRKSMIYLLLNSRRQRRLWKSSNWHAPAGKALRFQLGSAGDIFVHYEAIHTHHGDQRTDGRDDRGHLLVDAASRVRLDLAEHHEQQNHGRENLADQGIELRRLPAGLDRRRGRNRIGHVFSLVSMPENPLPAPALEPVAGAAVIVVAKEVLKLLHVHVGPLAQPGEQPSHKPSLFARPGHIGCGRGAEDG